MKPVRSFPERSGTGLHMGFEDPSKFKASYTEMLNEFYRIRNDIRDEFYSLFEKELRKKL